MTKAEVKERMEHVWDERGVRDNHKAARWVGPGHPTGGYVLKEDEK